jgi:hypothetical protein
MLSIRTRSFAALFALVLASGSLALAGGCGSDASSPPDEPRVPHLGEGTCAHDLCATGGAVDPACHTCAGDICAVDSFCCTVAWDSICVMEVESICGEICPASCGDGICGASEDCSSCAADCGTCPSCGNGVCEWGEDCSSCAGDCGSCPTCGHDKCVTGDPLAASCDACTASICAVDPFCCTVSWDVLCVAEVTSVCGETCTTTGCGDGVCGLLEDCTSCPADCGACPTCGDGTCDPMTETCGSCPTDCGACPTCGDGTCNPMTETCGSCPTDCGACPSCGDGTCGPGEDCATCATDCGTCSTCGDGVCAFLTESCSTCPADCGACVTQCNDGIDNDGDGFTDFPADAGCADAADDDETDPPPCTVFGTDSFGYQGCVETAAVPPCEDILATGTIGCTSDDCSLSVALPFTFDYYGVAQTSVSFVSNGKLGFPATTTYSNSCTIENNTIAPYWDDLYPPGGGSLRYQTFGTAPDRHVTFQWHVPHISGGTQYDIRAVLYEGSNNIDVCYVDVDTGLAAADNGISATSGIKGPTVGINYSCNTATITNGTVLHYTRPAAPVCGDGTCDLFESCSTCPTDCGVCPPVCGDATCDATEDCASCPGDCGTCPPACGDGTCNGTEDCASCPGDCGTCPPPPACSDGLDNDGDGIVDHPLDPGCASATDTDETDGCPAGPGCPECSDGIDNDADGLTDYPADGSCDSAGDAAESDCMAFGSDTFGYNACVQDDMGAIPPCEDLTTTGTLAFSSDDCSTSVTLPFTFDYYGVPQTTISVVSNGKLGFPGTTTYSNSCTIENNTIAPYWDDLYPPSGGGVRYQTFGTAPDRHFTVQWNVAHISGGTRYDIRAVLYEGSNDIDFCYLDVDTLGATTDFGASATVGIKGTSAGISYSCNSPLLGNNMLLHFDHP